MNDSQKEKPPILGIVFTASYFLYCFFGSYAYPDSLAPDRFDQAQLFTFWATRFTIDFFLFYAAAPFTLAFIAKRLTKAKREDALAYYWVAMLFTWLIAGYGLYGMWLINNLQP